MDQYSQTFSIQRFHSAIDLVSLTRVLIVYPAVSMATRLLVVVEINKSSRHFHLVDSEIVQAFTLLLLTSSRRFS